MAAPKKFLIPSLSEMETDVIELEKDKGSLFKRHKSSKDVTTDVESSTIIGETKRINEGSILDVGTSKNSDKISRCEGAIQSTSASGGVATSSSSLGNEKAPIQSNDESLGTSRSSAPVKPGSSNSLIVNPRQRGNPILKSVRNVPWEYGNIVPDYVMGPSNCALFLSLRYHQLHPNYIHDRLKSLGRSYELRVMLTQVDVKEPHHLLKDLAKICLLADCTLILAFSAEEAGRYLETYKVFENKPAEAIMEKTEDNYMAKFVDCLTRVKSVNKTDCATLLTAFGSLSNIMEANEDELCLCPGFGPQKAKRLRNIFQEPFIRSQSKAPETKDLSTEET